MHLRYRNWVPTLCVSAVFTGYLIFSGYLQCLSKYFLLIPALSEDTWAMCSSLQFTSTACSVHLCVIFSGCQQHVSMSC